MTPKLQLTVCRWLSNFFTVKGWLAKTNISIRTEGKTVNTYLNLIDTTIKSVVLYASESWGDPKDQNNLSKIEKFNLSLCKQILGVKNNTSSSKVLGELDWFPFRITIQTQLFKYLHRIPFVKEDCYLHKAFNEELSNKESGWVAKIRHLLDSYSMSNLILNIFKVLNGTVDKKEYKNKHNFFQKRAKNCCFQTLLYTCKNEKNNFFHKQKNSLKRKDI